MAYALAWTVQDYPAWYLGKLYLTATYGQSRSDNRSEGTGASLAATRTPTQSQRNLMMNNAKAPGKSLGVDFTGDEASSLIPFVDGYQTTYGAVTMTATPGQPIVVSWPGTSIRDGYGVIFATTNALDGALQPGVQYFARNVNSGAGTFELKIRDTDVSITALGGQSGTHEARRASSASPLGQSLGAIMKRLEDYDVSLGRTLKRRSFLSGGEGGKTAAELLPTAPAVFPGDRNYYDRLLSMVSRHNSIAADILGRQTVCETLLYLQHEADADDTTTDTAVWKTNTLAIHAAARADIATITGQSEAVEVIFDIGSSSFSRTVSNAATVSDIILKQVEIARENVSGHAWTVGPSYFLPRADSAGALHMTNEGVTVLAEMFARARSILYASGTPDFLYATSSSIDGSTITINCHVPVGSLAIDTTTIPDATGTSGAGERIFKGFWFEDAVGTTVTDVSVSGSTITVTLSGVPSGSTKVLRYAMAGLGSQYYTDVGGRANVKTAAAWGNIRDGLNVDSTFCPSYKLRNFLAPFKFSY